MPLKDFLKAKREAAGLTQNQVAQALGYKSSQFVSNWERGLSSPPLDKVTRIISLFGIDAKEMMKILMQEQEQILKKALLPSAKQNRKTRA